MTNSTIINIVVHDRNRSECPDKPWTATALASSDLRQDPRPLDPGDTGLGTTPLAAVADVLHNRGNWQELADLVERHNERTQPFVIVNGGLVANNPALPVFDLDLSDFADRNDVDDAIEKYLKMGKVMSNADRDHYAGDLLAFIQRNGDPDQLEVFTADLADERAK